MPSNRAKPPPSPHPHRRVHHYHPCNLKPCPNLILTPVKHLRFSKPFRIFFLVQMLCCTELYLIKTCIMHWNPNSRLELVAYYIITVVFCPCYMSVSCCKSSILPEILDSEMRLRLNLLLLLLNAIIYPAEGDMVLFSFFNWQKSFKILLVASFLNLMSIFHPTIYTLACQSRV